MLKIEEPAKVKLIYLTPQLMFALAEVEKMFSSMGLDTYLTELIATEEGDGWMTFKTGHAAGIFSGMFISLSGRLTPLGFKCSWSAVHGNPLTVGWAA